MSILLHIVFYLFLIMSDIVKKVNFHSKVLVRYFVRSPVDSSVCWMREARDRVRFDRRIRDVEQQIDWVFNPQHRRRVYTKLYGKTCAIL